MPWFGHRAACPRLAFPLRERTALWLVCPLCMPELVPRCGMCGKSAPRVGELEGFVAYAFGGLCDACVSSVESAGPARERRARTTQAREAVVLGAYPQLAVEERARRRVTIGGTIAGRQARLTFRDSAREGDDERYVIRVELRVDRATITREELRLFPSLVARLSRGSPSIATDGFRHVRIAFLHLGRRDTLHAIDGLLDTVATIEAPS